MAAKILLHYMRVNNFPTNCHKKTLLVSKHYVFIFKEPNALCKINIWQLLISIISKWQPQLNHNGPPWEHGLADYGGVYFFMFCVYVCTCMVYILYVRPVYTCVHAASVIINDGNQIRRRARTNSSGPNTNNVENSFMARVVALRYLRIIF